MKKTPFISVGTGVIIGTILDKVGLCVAIGIIFGAAFSSEDNNDIGSSDKKE